MHAAPAQPTSRRICWSPSAGAIFTRPRAGPRHDEARDRQWQIQRTTSRTAGRSRPWRSTLHWGASAQEADPAAAPPAAGGPDSAWAKLCNTDGATGKELCLTIQEIRADTGQFIASATIRTIAGEAKKSLITAVPPGMLLQPGLRIQIDDAQQVRSYGICFPNALRRARGRRRLHHQAKAGGKLTLTTLNQQAVVNS
jgi:invasion protein IalB